MASRLVRAMIIGLYFPGGWEKSCVVSISRSDVENYALADNEGSRRIDFDWLAIRDGQGEHLG
jgi:hypothetical protein